jgi:xylulose-5-phosphate/fructose-6-phosphate phosphoketolase
VDVQARGPGHVGATPALGPWLAELFRTHRERRDFRIVCPDERESDRLGAVL